MYFNLLGTCSMAARLGGFLAPYVASLGSTSHTETGSPLPLLILGVSTLVGGSTALLLPETMGEELPQTVKEAEQLIKRGRKKNYKFKNLDFLCLKTNSDNTQP